jgi:glycosyltransferase involved in cell wall biosynthesis
MAVYNGEPFLDEAVRSILNQTYRDFEFLIIDDASQDGTWRLLHEYKDSRLRLVKNERNMGLAATLNRGLGMIDCEFIARMDSDDISVPRRLEWQIDFMETHTQAGIVGMSARVFGIASRKGLIRYPSGASKIKAFLLFANSMIHPTVMMRRQWLDKFNLRYDPFYSRSEDYDFFIRASRHFALENMNKIGLFWRMHEENATISCGHIMREQVYHLLSRQLMSIGLEVGDEELEFHYRIGAGERLGSEQELLRGEAWLFKIKDAALKSGLYEKEGIEDAVGRVWFRLCANSTPITWRIIQRYRQSVLSKGYRPALQEWAIFFASTTWYHVFRQTVACL